VPAARLGMPPRTGRLGLEGTTAYAVAITHIPENSFSLEKKTSLFELEVDLAFQFEGRDAYLRAVWLLPLGYLFGKQLLRTESHESEGAHLATHHPVEQALRNTTRGI